jgi:DNA-binding transcriptional regulator LsrR (DeoR family)
MSGELSIDQRVLYVYVALQNLAHGRPINEIADEVGVSRFAAARMVRRARELGLIEVRAAADDPVDVELSRRLAQAFGLDSAIVVVTPSPREDDVREMIAEVAARFLIEHTQQDDVIGLTPGRTLVAVSRKVPELPWVDVVQLTGVGAPRLEDGVEAIANLGRAGNGATYPLYAPIFVEAGEAALIMKQPANQRTLKRFERLSKAFLTIGGWPDSSLLARQAAEFGVMDDLLERGVVAEIGTVLLDEEGRTVETLTERVIGITERQLRAVPVRVAVGGGPGKEDALAPVLRSGIPNIVITDMRSAERALAAGPRA